MELEICFGFKPLIYSHPTQGNEAKGRKLFEANHVFGIVERNNVIKAQVIRQTSVSLKPYTVTVEFNQTREVTITCCQCLAGVAGFCKHVSAVIIAVNCENDATKTSHKCEWIKPSSSSKAGQCKYSKGKKFEDMFIATTCTRNFAPVNLSLKDVKEIPSMLTLMMKAETMGNTKRMDEEPSSEAIYETFDTLIDCQRSSTFLDDLNKLPFHIEELCCIETFNALIFCDAKKVCVDTIKSKAAWKEARKYRITASRCYSLYTYAKDNWKQKVSNYFGAKEFTNDFVQHGLWWEKAARKKYASQYGVDVVETGLIVCQSDCWLAASPDGVVMENHHPIKLLEIKCPFKGKTMTAKDVIHSCQFLKIGEDNQIVLNKKHPYFSQVQVGMGLLNVSLCDFVVFCSFDQSLIVLPVEFDENFCKELLFKLKTIYFTKNVALSVQTH